MINSRLRSIRKELSLTQENLARVLGIGKSALSMIETGKASLSERNKNILVQELNVNPDWLETGGCKTASFTVNSIISIIKMLISIVNEKRR